MNLLPCQVVSNPEEQTFVPERELDPWGTRRTFHQCVSFEYVEELSQAASQASTP